MRPIAISIADDHILYTETLSFFLRSQENPPVRILDIAHSGRQMIACLEKQQPDILLLDLNMPDGDGFSVLEFLQGQNSLVKVIALTMYDSPKFIKDVLQNGGFGYLLKSCSIRELTNAIQSVLQEKTYIAEGLKIFPKLQGANGSEVFEDEFQIKYNLTRRETEILVLISEAKSNKEIAEQLFISDQTVSVHRKNIMRKLNVTNTAGLIKFAMENLTA